MTLTLLFQMLLDWRVLRDNWDDLIGKGDRFIFGSWQWLNKYVCPLFAVGNIGSFAMGAVASEIVGAEVSKETVKKGD
ncbi:hypothetical protein HP436_13635 [Pseudomonas sp. CrR14]|nr:hypothetical protein [Pseudomonas sp. CrR14]